MVRGNIDNGFSQHSYLRIGKVESSKYCTGMKIVTEIKSVYPIVYINYYTPCLCYLNRTT